MKKKTEIDKIYQETKRTKIVAFTLMFILIFSLFMVSKVREDKLAKEANIDNLPYYGQVLDFTLTNIRNESYTFSHDNGKIRL